MLKAKKKDSGGTLMREQIRNQSSTLQLALIDVIDGYLEEKDLVKKCDQVSQFYLVGADYRT